jgi:FlaA1/EpsC-like NDP-sugar epimerase
MGADLVLTAACWLGTYQMRFVSGVLPVLRGMPPEDLYYWSTFGVLALWHVAFRLGGLYEPWRLKRLGQEAWVISRAVLLGLTALIVVSFVYRYQDTEYSRLFLLVFVPTNVAALVGSRVVVRLILRAMRSSGLNLRHLLVIGSGPLARQVIDKVRANPWAGLRVVGMIADEHEPRDPHQGVEVVGGMDDLSGAIERSGAQQAFIALPFERFGCIKRVMAELADSTVAVRLVADLADFGLVMNTSIDDFDGLPVLSLVDRPAVGAMALVKRGFDLLFSALVLVLLSPLLALLAIAVRVSVGGSVIYRQERM